jgi:hypothetical protein
VHSRGRLHYADGAQPSFGVLFDHHEYLAEHVLPPFKRMRTQHQNTAFALSMLDEWMATPP